MQGRILFNSKKKRDMFFEMVLEKHSFNKWKELSDRYNLPRQVLTKYRSGDLTIPKDLFDKLCLKFGEDQVFGFLNCVSRKKSNWGQSKGGFVTYSQHKDIFEKGRKKGLKKIAEINRRFSINIPLNKELAYFIGLFIGDGFTNKYGRYYLTQFVGHKFNELDYYRGFFSDLSESLFGFSPKIKEYPGVGFIRVNFYSKDLFLLITKRFKIKAGKKSSEVLIPREILNSSIKIFLSCVAGLYDAEGCVFLDKRSNYKKFYPRIDFHVCNQFLINQICQIFDKVNVPYYVSKGEERIVIYGYRKIKTFLSYVPIQNPKHLSKLKDIGLVS